MKKAILVGFASTLFLLPGCSKKNEFQPPPPPEVTVQNPTQKDVTTYKSFTGRLAASDSADIRARVKGFLKSIDFTDGQRVEKGDLLFTIEDEEYKSTEASAEARVEQTKAKLKLAESTLERTKKAFETKAVSELDVLSAEAELDAAKASMLEAEAALQKARLNLSYTEISAPFAGRIGESGFSVGNLVGDGGATLLTTIIVEAPINAYFNVDERSLLPYLSRGVRENKPGTKLPSVKLQLADGKIHPEEGVVNYIDPEVDQGTGTLTARATFSNEGIKLFPGLFAKVLLPNEVNGAILVPEQAIQRDLTGTYVLTVDAGNTVEPKYITVGERVETTRIVAGGLSTEDRIIVKGIQRARPGIKVRIAEPESEKK
ncbi:MAG: efflux RND transporter periplasmic adaptor subunit, partial [Verrucomicrobiota bacterium]